MIEDEDARIELFKEVVASNNKLLHELRLLIKECGFSDLSGDRAHRYKKVLEWYDSEAEEKRSEFFDKIHKLAESFDIPEDFLGTLLEFVVMGTINLPRNRGVSIVHRHGHGIGREIVIGPDATMSNLDMHIIRHFQRKTLLEEDPPQRPANIPGSRSKDWKPLWLWTKRHPNITHTELAEILNYDRSYLSRKLNELELK